MERESSPSFGSILTLSLLVVYNQYEQLLLKTEKSCLIILLHRDEVLGNDSWALKHNWVSVTPLGLRQDIPGRMVSFLYSEYNKHMAVEYTL